MKYGIYKVTFKGEVTVFKFIPSGKIGHSLIDPLGQRPRVEIFGPLEPESDKVVQEKLLSMNPKLVLSLEQPWYKKVKDWLLWKYLMRKKL